ncbi:MAG: hypothetical protein RLZZ558_651 [Planctomycetota bacterium]
MWRPGRLIVIAVAVMGLAAFISGFWITAGVRERARLTDRQLEAIVAAIEHYAREHGGDMPQSEQAIQGMSGWTPPPDMAEGLRLLTVHWPPSPDLAPVLAANGRPTGLGTLARLNAQLRSRARGSAVEQTADKPS